MATFSVVSHDDQLGSSLGSTLATTHFRQPTSTLIAPTGTVDPPVGSHEQDELPATVLELPDLAAALEATAQWRTSMGSRLFWVGIVLGALLALFLIWNPGGRAVRQLDDAPTWSGNDEAHSTLGDAGHKHTHQKSSSNSAPSWPPVTRGTVQPPAHHAHESTNTPPQADAEQPHAEPTGTPPDKHGELDASPATPEPGPAFHDGMGRASAPPATRTARSADAHWDGTAPAVEPHNPPTVAPGEAAPTGVIKSVVHE